MIVSGVGQDKSHTGALINYIGNGIYNAVHQTDPEMLSNAFEEVLRNQSYRYVYSASVLAVVCCQCCSVVLTWCRARSQAIAKEYGKYNAVQIVDDEVQQVLRGRLNLKSWLAGWL